MNIIYLLLFVILAFVSYGFVDPNLTLSASPLVTGYIKPLFFMVYQQRFITTGIFTCILLFLFFLFRTIFIKSQTVFPTTRVFWKWIVPLVLVLILSYPMLSYDLFNYMTTAKVAFTYHENPYIVMPIEISNDANLAFTRAANKVALYGPVWLLLTWVPHTLGMGNIWETLIAFKFINALWYIGFCILIWRVTKSMKNVVFFSLNPLVLIETLVSGHNDIVMMVLACGGLLLWEKRKWTSHLMGLVLLVLSVFIKGATVVLVPLLFFRKLTQERLFFIASCLLLVVFFILAPIREELYPWYAVWFLSLAAFLPYPKYSLFWQFCIVLSLGLELRHVPYMAMGYYEGPGPMLRAMVTVIPVILWILYKVYKNYKSYKFYKNP